MPTLTLLILIFVANFAHAQIDIMQSSPEIKWHTIENKSVKLIYPNYFEAESKYVANLIEHYSHVAGQSFGITQPQKFPLIIRPEVALPNGYVTLMPRRSEWFPSAMFSPALGSTEWLQTLAIHEYRHINQMDYFSKGRGTKIIRSIMGDTGKQLAMAFAMPTWYMEGDAVWAETKYTDAGRGRSPRFLERLKALVISDQIPTFDEFVGGSYRTRLANHYVFGYALVSYARLKFGDDVWKTIMLKSADFPYPTRFYYTFDKVTGQRFEDFYTEAMNDLKEKWSQDKLPKVAKPDFRENYFPQKVGNALYYISQTLDSYPTIIKEENGKKTHVTQLYFFQDLNQIHFGTQHAVTTEFTPDNRYGHKNFSDLLLIDLQSGAKQRLTSERALYNPRINKSGTQIIAIEFTKDQAWSIVEFDLSGNLISRTPHKDGKFVEVQYLDDKKAIALSLDKKGYRSIVEVDLTSQSISKTLLESSRNMITAIQVAPDHSVILEAQYKGRSEIIRITNDSVFQCTNSQVGAHTPSSDGVNVYYSDVDANGSLNAQTPVAACKTIAMAELTGFRYLGDGPSDNYNKFPLVQFPEQESLYTQNVDTYDSRDYSELDIHGLRPHSWGFVIGRGTGLGVQIDNYLRTLGTGVLLGSDAEEGQSYLGAHIDYKKYYPIMSLTAENRNRLTKNYLTNDQTGWTEKNIGFSLLLPYIFKAGLYNFSASVSGRSEYTDTNSFKLNEVQIPGSGSFYKTGGALTLSVSKDSTSRAIIAPWLLDYTLRYDDAQSSNDSSSTSSYRVLQSSTLQTPGIFDNDGIQITYNEQIQTENSSAYRFVPSIGFFNYVFSRGYNYREVSRFQKSSANYVFPVAYPNWNISRYYYIKRVYGTLFYDSTRIPSVSANSQLDSYGAEVMLESLFFRILPMTLGARVAYRALDSETRSEVFIGSALF